MALPQDGQNANGLTKVTEIPKGKELIFIDPTTNEGGIITLEDLTTQILNKLTSKIFTLDQGNFTLIEALNKLNSNRGIASYHGNSFSSRYVRPYINKPNKYSEPSAILVLGYEGVGVLKFESMTPQYYPSSYTNLYGDICKVINSKITIDFNDRNRQVTFITPEGIELAFEEINV